MTAEPTDYTTFRGQCRTLSEAAIAEDPTLVPVRGWYFCPIWNVEEQHWWTKRPDGSIYDPSARQFPSAGAGDYREFTGTFICDECGQEFTEETGYPTGNSWLICSSDCFGAVVGF
jgi:hypothetical protein